MDTAKMTLIIKDNLVSMVFDQLTNSTKDRPIRDALNDNDVAGGQQHKVGHGEAHQQPIGGRPQMTISMDLHDCLIVQLKS